MTEDAHKPLASSSIGKTIKKGERVTALVAEAADGLSAVNDDLKQEVAGGGASPAIESALAKGEAVEFKVQDAADELVSVNAALNEELKERHLLESQLAAVTEQGAVDRHAALHDPLTGLPNRALFNDRLEHALAQAVRHGWVLAVMFVDLDNFKEINDSYGHVAGDRVLQTVARQLQDNIRGDDTISRYGGDEFLYVLAEIRDEADAEVVAGTILRTIRQPMQLTVNGAAIKPCVNASIGISLFPRNGKTGEELIRGADAAMYEAKQTKSGYAFAR